MSQSIHTAPIVTIFGGSGFIGRYACQRMAEQGWRVRAAVRRPNEALFLKPYGVVGQVAPVQANVRDDASCAAAIAGAEVVVYSVGVLFESGKNGFGATQAEGPARVARLAKEAGVKRFVLISAIGADAGSDSDYARTKAEGERAVRDAFPQAVILRPSVVFGPEDDFFNRFGMMSRISPVLPIVGADTRFQPVYVDDVAAAIEAAALGRAEPGATYELGGPRTASFRELMETMLQTVKRKALVVNLPNWLAKWSAFWMELWPLVGFQPLLTRDQVRLLKHDNVVAADARGFDALGLRPTPMEAVLESYLWTHRPYGQYARITGTG